MDWCRNLWAADRRLAAAALVALAACTPGTPDSGAGVGFADYSTYELRAAQRSAGLAARQGGGPVISDEVVDPGSAAGAVPGAAAGGGIAAAELAQAGIPVAPAAAPPAGAGAAAASPAPAPAAPAPAGGGHAGLSDEQDFDAVSSRESIQSDKDRLAAQRAAYQQIAPEALPGRPGASDTAVIDFALSTSNAVGQQVYGRPGRTSRDRFYRACARYPSQDVAQEEFLKDGGPEVDRRGVDPDGDGFACFWDPVPFRLARQGAVAAPVAREVLPGQAAPGTVGPDGVMVRTSDYDRTPLE